LDIRRCGYEDLWKCGYEGREDVRLMAHAQGCGFFPSLWRQVAIVLLVTMVTSDDQMLLSYPEPAPDRHSVDIPDIPAF
jgi:hypothetical protein